MNDDYEKLLAQYESKIQKLNKEVELLKSYYSNPNSTEYKENIKRSREAFPSDYNPKDLNPLVKMVRSKSLSPEEKRKLIFPDLYPSRAQDVFYQWVAPDRLVATRDKQWYWVMALIMGIIIIFSLIVREYIFIALSLSVFLFYYILVSVPPSSTIYRLTKQGIEIGEGDYTEIFAWGQLLDYGYYYKHNTEVVYINTLTSVPPKLILLFNQEDRKNVDLVLDAILPYQAPPKQNLLNKFRDGIYIPRESFKELQKKVDEYFDRKYSEIIDELKNEGKVEEKVTIEDIKKIKAIETVSVVEKLKKDPYISRKLGI